MIRAPRTTARTSRSHLLEIATVELGPGFGRIGMSLCPGKKDPHAMTGAWDRDLTADLAAIRDWGAAAAVTLMESHELRALQIEGIGCAIRRQHMDWLHLPIPDVSVPTGSFERDWVAAGEGLRARLRAGADVLVHCRGGLGRSGTIAARLMVELGTPAATAISAVRKARPGAIETREQEQFVRGISGVAERQPGHDRADIEDRAIGALLGLAVGDAVGTTLEFEPRDDAAELLTDMVGGGPFGLQPGEWTDDTAMALALADSLAARGNVDEQELLRRFVQWWREGTYSCTGRCFDIGNTTRAALAAWERTRANHPGPAKATDAGNGSLMRLSPVAIRFRQASADRRDAAARQSRTTHGAAEAIDACVLFADVLADAIAGKPRSVVLAPREGVYAGKIADIAAGKWRSKSRPQIRGSGYVAEALEAALWCVARTADYRSAVLLAANLREDADTTAAITGQLAGAIYGSSGIPISWKEQVAWRARIERAAVNLFAASQTL
jgi:ADP-ribosyl-[dinitrogen reductase] hydrolase